MSTSYEHKGLGEGLGGPARSGPYAGGAAALAAAGVEFGAPRPILTMDGKAFGAGGQLETKQAAGVGWAPSVPGGVPQTVWDAETETKDWMALPDACVLPQDRRAAEIAVEAARQHLPGFPDRVSIRYMQPHSREMARIYGDIAETGVKVFSNVPKTGGTFFPDRPGEVWVNIAQAAGEVARAAVHECVHLWRSRVGTKGMDQDAQEEEADGIADRLLPVILAVAEEEGGFAPSYRLR